uniref:Uncharacterized protein n=1 Tax=Arundo donax TaxID=35708 RepID=A0A0A8XUG6_ARUDO
MQQKNKDTRTLSYTSKIHRDMYMDIIMNMVPRGAK